MKSSQVAVAGGVFGVVLIVCFALVGFGSKGEATAKPDADPVPAAQEPVPIPPQPTVPPKPAAPTGGYDAGAALGRSSESGLAVVATWNLPAADVKEFGDYYHSVRLTGERFVGASDGGVRVLNARTGEPTGAGEVKTVGGAALSPHGDWAIQAAPEGVSLLDLTTGKRTKAVVTGKQAFTGPAAFGAANAWGAVLGTDDGKTAMFRVLKDGTVERLGTFRADTGRGEASRVAQLFASAEAGRFVLNRPAERSPEKRFLSWTPGEKSLLPLPAFDAEIHDAVRGFRLSADGRRAAMFNETVLKVFDLSENRVLLSHQADGLKIGDVAFAPNGRLVVAYASRAVDGDADLGEKEVVHQPGHAWVLDADGKAAVGSKFHFADAGIKGGFRRLVVSQDGGRLAVVEKSGRVHLVDANRAFGPGALGAAPATGTAPQPGAPSSAPNKSSDS